MSRINMPVSIAAILLLLLISGCSVPKYQATYADSRRAILEGKTKEALASYESQAEEAEKNAEASWLPQQYWHTATAAYVEASRAAQLSGQLQKAITYGEKALQMAEKTKDPVDQVSAIHLLIDAYRAVRSFAKARDLLETGFQIVKEIPSNTFSRLSWEGVLFLRLGRDLMSQRQYEKAIDAYSQSLSLYENYLSRLSGVRSPSQSWLEDTRTSVTVRIASLGNAFRAAGRLQEALEQYQRAFGFIKVWRLRYAYEGALYRSMAEIYLEMRDTPQALENFHKALALAEGQQRPAAISFASRRIGDVLRETGKPAEAVSYYQQAIRQIESVRSLLQSDDFRQSFFEGGLDAYVSMIDVLSESGKPEEAFSFSERARSRAFLDLLGSKAQLSKVKSGLLEEERALQERIAAIKARMSG